jgi:hypothetical protein
MGIGQTRSLRGDSGNSQIRVARITGKTIYIRRGIRYAHQVVSVLVPVLIADPKSPPTPSIV